MRLTCVNWNPSLLSLCLRLLFVPSLRLFASLSRSISCFKKNFLFHIVNLSCLTSHLYCSHWRWTVRFFFHYYFSFPFVGIFFFIKLIICFFFFYCAYNKCDNPHNFECILCGSDQNINSNRQHICHCLAMTESTARYLIATYNSFPFCFFRCFSVHCCTVSIIQSMPHTCKRLFCVLCASAVI